MLKGKWNVYKVLFDRVGENKCYVYCNEVCSVLLRGGFLLRVPHSVRICYQIRITTKNMYFIPHFFDV